MTDVLPQSTSVPRDCWANRRWQLCSRTSVITQIRAGLPSVRKDKTDSQYSVKIHSFHLGHQQLWENLENHDKWGFLLRY